MYTFRENHYPDETEEQAARTDEREAERLLEVAAARRAGKRIMTYSWLSREDKNGDDKLIEHEAKSEDGAD
jgi:hypothetical protein